jgi:hypothetical protein
VNFIKNLSSKEQCKTNSIKKQVNTASGIHALPLALSPPPTMYQFSSIIVPAWPLLGVIFAP